MTKKQIADLINEECPICGKQLHKRCIIMEDNRYGYEIYCVDEECSFKPQKRLPKDVEITLWD